MANKADNIETEYLEVCKKNEWEVLYQKIRSESGKNSYTVQESVKPQNKSLNRYRDVSPYDHSRIVLHRGSTDYINANLIKVQRANRQYILTQGPLANTVSHFWLMVWEQSSCAVLMLNKLVEKRQEKCFQYWPSKTGPEHAMRMDDVRLTLEYVEYNDHSYYLTRTFLLTDLDTSASRKIVQFHYTTWPDFGVPSSPTAFLDFLKKVREAGALNQDVGPAIVHCSAGIGRSGTFCLVDSCLVLIESFGFNSVNVKEILLELRRYRMGLIQTPEQLRFSYQAIIEGAKRLNQNGEEKILEENSNNLEEVNGGSGEEIAEVHSSEEGEDEDEPPPLPPPRMDSLNRNPVDRPLPNIPNSTSLTEFTFEDSESDKEMTCPSGPLPTVPGEDEEEEDEEVVEEEEEEEISSADESDQSDESPVISKKSDRIEDNRCTSPEAELRQRKRAERNEQLAARVREMKRRQQSSEQWTQLKRAKTTLPD